MAMKNICELLTSRKEPFLLLRRFSKQQKQQNQPNQQKQQNQQNQPNQQKQQRQPNQQNQEKEKEKKKVAVVLSGCGVLDGTEIHEAAATAVHLSRLELEPVFYALDCPQADVVDHYKGCPSNESRSMIKESARIARGKISALNDLRECDAEAVIFPGGFGAAKSLSTYNTDKECFTINEEVMRVMTEFCRAKKPQGYMCIAAILPAKMFPCARITLGEKGNAEKWPHSAAIDVAKSLGAVVESRDVENYTLDKQNLIFTTPAYMYEGPFYEIFNGIGNMIENMYKIMK